KRFSWSSFGQLQHSSEMKHVSTQKFRTRKHERKKRIKEKIFHDFVFRDFMFLFSDHQCFMRFLTHSSARPIVAEAGTQEGAWTRLRRACKVQSSRRPCWSAAPGSDMLAAARLPVRARGP